MPFYRLITSTIYIYCFSDDSASFVYFSLRTCGSLHFMSFQAMASNHFQILSVPPHQSRQTVSVVFSSQVFCSSISLLFSSFRCADSLIASMCSSSQLVSSYLWFFYQWPPHMPKRKEGGVGGGWRMRGWLMLSAGGDFTTRVQGPSWRRARAERVRHKSGLGNFCTTLLSPWCLCFLILFYLAVFMSLLEPTVHIVSVQLNRFVKVCTLCCTKIVKFWLSCLFRM